MKIATWNVNSVKTRFEILLNWLKTVHPDVLLLQEIKTVTEDFPALEIEALGYKAAVVGQKSYNGVAILSRQPFTVRIIRLPGDTNDEQARYIEADVAGKMTVASIYLPNGNPIDTDKFRYKLTWMERLRLHAITLLAEERPVILGGDYNVCPEGIDTFDPRAMADDALCSPEARAAFRRIANLGYTDAIRSLYPHEPMYSYWDYQAGRWQRDHGLRIDHLLLSPQAADRLTSAGVDRDPRGLDRPSDHTPVWCDLDIT
ncbi:MAG: exodeoxyribonuclease III [Alphaproteobacteria bacterium]